MQSKGIKKTSWKLSAFSLMMLMVTQTHAAGYKLEFQSPSVLADAGDAAVVNDVGTNWYNSAGLVKLPQQLVVSDIYMYQHVSFKGFQSAPSPFGAAYSYAANGSASSYANINLPAIHYGLPFGSRYAFGLSVVPAWGLLEDYGPNSSVRYGLVRIYTRTIDIAPSLAVSLTPQWSVGFGPNIHYFALQQKYRARTQGPSAFGGTTSDSVARASADSWNAGGHIGVLFNLNEGTRIGLNYRSRIVQKLTGYGDFDLNGAGHPSTNLETNQFRLNLPMPPTISLSLYHEFSPVWAMMGTIAYDQWSVVRHLHVVNQITPTGLTNVVIPQDFQNTFDLGIGTHYKLNERWLLRASFKYEQTPTQDAYRDINFPDGEKFGLNLGAHYQWLPKLGFDFLLAHVYTRGVPIRNTNPLSNVYTNGKSNTTIDLAGAQLVWDV